MSQLQTLLMMDATSSVLPVDVLKNSPTWARHGVGPRVRELNCATRPLNAFLHMTDREFGVHARVQGSCCAARRQNTPTSIRALGHLDRSSQFMPCSPTWA